MKRLLGFALVLAVLVGCMNKPIFVQVTNSAGSDKPITVKVEPNNPINVAPKANLPITANAGDKPIEAGLKATPGGAAAGVAETVLDQAHE